MKENKEKDIDKLRAEIDRMDKEIVNLLNKRARNALTIRGLKKKINIPIYDPKREEDIFQMITSYNQGPLYDDDIKEIYDKILNLMKSIEEN